MVDISITATAVLKGSNAVTKEGMAGATIAAGQAVYKSSTTNTILLADSNSATAEARTADGIALNGGATGQPIEYQTSGDMTMNAVLTANTAYFMSDTPGGICPIADVGAGEYLQLLGIAKSTTVLMVLMATTGVSN